MANEAEGGTSMVRRNRPGTKAKDMYNWPDQDFNDMETVLAGKSFNDFGTPDEAGIVSRVCRTFSGSRGRVQKPRLKLVWTV